MWKCVLRNFNVYPRHESISKITVPSNGCCCESTTWCHFANVHISGAERPKQLFFFLLPVVLFIHLDYFDVSCSVWGMSASSWIKWNGVALSLWCSKHRKKTSVTFLILNRDPVTQANPQNLFRRGKFSNRNYFLSPKLQPAGTGEEQDEVLSLS